MVTAALRPRSGSPAPPQRLSTGNRRALSRFGSLVKHPPSREHDGDGGAASEGAVDDEAAAVLLDKHLGQRQSETGAAMAARQADVDLLEGLQRRRNIFGLHADAGIRHRD